MPSPARAIALALALMAAASPLAAQGYRLAIDPGTEVRFRVRADSMESARALVDGVVNDSLRLAPSRGLPSRAIPLGTLSSLEVRGGEDKRRGIIRGAAIGAVITAVAGGIDVSRDEISAGDAVGTIIVNSIFGGLLGWIFAPAGWEALPLPPRAR